MGDKQKKERRVPKLRFPGFTDEWEQRKLGELCEKTFGGGTPTTSNEGYWGGNIPWIQSSDITDGKLFGVVPRKHITQEGLNNSATQLVPENSIAIITRVSVGKLAFMPFPYTTSQDFLSLSKLNTEPLFTVYACYKKLQSELNMVQGTSIKGITKNGLLANEIMVPKYDEQRQIGTFFNQLDCLITLHQRKCDETKALKKYMLQKMFPKDGMNVPEIRFAGFTNAWEQRKLGEFTNVLSASRVHKNDWTANGVPFYRSSDVVSAFKGNDNEKTFISIELYEELIKSSGKLEKDDILITGGGSIGIPYIVPNNEPLYSKDADLIWVKKSEEHDSEYLYTYFTSHRFREYIGSISHVGTIAHYTIEQVKDTPIQLPSIAEQRSVGSFFHHIDCLITLHQRKLTHLKELKKGLLQQMFV